MRTSGSFLGFEMSLLQKDDLEEKHGPKFSDIFNIEAWKRYSEKANVSSLISFKELLTTGPKKLVIVQRICHETRDHLFENASKEFSRRNGFEIVREFCIPNSESFSPDEFRRLVYNGLEPHDTLVLFRMWTGIEGNIGKAPHLAYRIPIPGLKHCWRWNFINFMDSVPVSDRIMEDSKQYARKYFPGKNGYIAVMFRIEKLFFNRQLAMEEERLQRGLACIQGIMKVVNTNTKDALHEVFLAMDLGKYGTAVYRDSANTSAFVVTGHRLFQSLYKNQLSIQQWEDSFETIADFKKPGYIAMLQLRIAMNARVLILAGGGSFQSIAERSVATGHFSNAKILHVKGC